MTPNLKTNTDVGLSTTAPFGTLPEARRAADTPRVRIALAAWALSVLILTACSDDKEPSAEPRFQRLLTEVVQSNSRYAGKPDSASAARDSLIRAAGYTTAELREFVDANRNNHESWLALLGRLEDRFRDSLKTPSHMRRPRTPRVGN